MSLADRAQRPALDVRARRVVQLVRHLEEPDAGPSKINNVQIERLNRAGGSQQRRLPLLKISQSARSVRAVWYLVALALPVTLSGVAVMINMALGAEADLTFGLGQLVRHPVHIRDGPPHPRLRWCLGGAGMAGLCGAPPTDRAYALRAALMLGLLIAGWQLPLIVVGQVSWTDMIQIIGAVIVFNWLFNNAKGSVLIIMLSHAMNKKVWSTLTSKVVAEPDLAQQAVLQAVVWCLAAIMVVILTGPTNLSRRHAKQEQPIELRRESAPAVPIIASWS